MDVSKEEDNPKKWQCGFCQAVFDEEATLNSHFGFKKKSGKHVCPSFSCGRSFRCAKQFHEHFQCHKVNKRVCYVCGEIIENEAKYKGHLSKHSLINNFTCNICFEEFEKDDELLIHITSKHDTGNLKLEKETKLNKTQDEKSELKTCENKQSQQSPTAQQAPRLSLRLTNKRKQESSEITDNFCNKVDSSPALKKSITAMSTSTEESFVEDKVTEQIPSENTNTVLKEHFASDYNEERTKDKAINTGNEQVTLKSVKVQEGIGVKSANSHKLKDTPELYNEDIFSENKKSPRKTRKPCTNPKVNDKNKKSNFNSNLDNESKHTKQGQGQSTEQYQGQSLADIPPVYTCDTCDESFRQRQELDMHMKTLSHNQQCKTCGLQIKSYNNMQRHEKLHLKNKPHGCEICSKTFHRADDLKMHMRSHSDTKQFECDLCNLKYFSMGNLIRHKEGHKTNELTCPLCSSAFVGAKNLFDHVEEKHMDSSTFACQSSYCNMRFCSQNRLAKHIQNVHILKKKRFSYKHNNESKGKCNETATSSSTIETVEETKKDPLPTCDSSCLNVLDLNGGECKSNEVIIDKIEVRTEKELNETDTVRRNDLENINKLEENMNENNFVNEEDVKLFDHTDLACKNCFISFETVDKLMKHKKEFCDGANTSKRYFTCEVCKIPFNTRLQFFKHKHCEHGEKEVTFQKCYICEKDVRLSSFERHLKGHLMKGNFKCGICKEHFTSKILLIKHKKTHYSSKGSHPCPYKDCLKVMSTISNLSRHIKMHREPDACHVCSYCKKTFSMQSYLQYHVSKQHSNKNVNNEQEFLCTECGKTIKLFHNFKRHMKCHSDEKPYKCGFCEKGFKRSDDLKQHMKYHSDAFSFQCEHCEKQFKVRSLYTKHLRKHLQQPYVCSDCGKVMKQKKAMSRHKESGECEGKRWTCELCKESFHLGSLLRKHIKLKHPDALVPRELFKKQRVQRDKRYNIRENFKTFACAFCSQVFLEENMYFEHILKRHPETVVSSPTGRIINDHPSKRDTRSAASDVDMSNIPKTGNESPQLRCTLSTSTTEENINEMVIQIDGCVDYDSVAAPSIQPSLDLNMLQVATNQVSAYTGDKVVTLPTRGQGYQEVLPSATLIVDTEKVTKLNTLDKCVLETELGAHTGVNKEIVVILPPSDRGRYQCSLCEAILDDTNSFITHMVNHGSDDGDVEIDMNTTG